MNHHDWPPATLSPVKAAAAASFVSLLFICWVDGAVVMRLGVWWAELLVFSLVPLLLAFVILYRSSWRQGMMAPARACLAALFSGIIFAGVLIGLGIAMVLLALVYSCYLDGFTRFHY